MLSFSELCKELNEPENKIIYWKAILKKHGLIDPHKGLGNKDIFTAQDVQAFRRLQEHLGSGAKTATEAIRLIQDNVRPEEALVRYKNAQREIAILQKKVLQLRKPLWKRLVAWIRGVLSGVLSPKTEQ